MSNFNEMVSSFVNTNSRAKYPRGLRAKTNIIEDAPFINAMKEEQNWGYTENSGVKHITTNSALLDMFGQGGSMRNRSEDDIITMFKKAYKEDATYALKCLFYLRDCRGGAGERRFFRVCLHWLAQNDTDAVLRNLEHISEYGRYDDLFVLFDTPVEKAMIELIKKQLIMDMKACENPNGAVSLLAKWMKSNNCSSKESKAIAERFTRAFGITSREYRKTLSVLRRRIKVLERLMSQGKWSEIDFSGIPSRAALIYREAFKKHEGDRYAQFMADKNTKVNASVLNPVDIAHQIFNNWHPDKVDRNAWDKAWECLPDYYNGKEEPGIAIVDVSGSMSGVPMEAAVSMGAYIAERGNGPFQNHFITFSGNPQLVEFEGVDLYDKFQRAKNADWGGTTNIEAVFDLMLNTARKYHTRPQDMPKTLYIFSDMEFNGCISRGAASLSRWNNGPLLDENDINTVIEEQIRKWRSYGYEAPRVVFWNLDARHENIPALGKKFSYVSGFSMSMVETILGGKDGYDLMMEKLNSERYKKIQ